MTSALFASSADGGAAPRAGAAAVLLRLLCEVRIGAVEHELTFVWRT